MVVTHDGELRPVHCTANLVRSGDATEDYIAAGPRISRRVSPPSARWRRARGCARLAQEAAGVGVWEHRLVRGGSRQSHRAHGCSASNGTQSEYRMADVADRLGTEQVAELRKAIVSSRADQGARST